MRNLIYKFNGELYAPEKTFEEILRQGKGYPKIVFLGKCSGSLLVGQTPEGLDVEVEWDFEFPGVFSANGIIWNKNHTDCESCGQILDEIVQMFPVNEFFLPIYRVWKKYHLNNFIPGSPRQMEFLEHMNLLNADYEEQKEKLKKYGLDPDKSFLINDVPYSYGTGWIMKYVPEEVQKEIHSWDFGPYRKNN